MTPARTARAPDDRLAASLMCADFRTLSRQLAALRRGGVGRLHLDFGDGRFVPNFPLGMEVFDALPRQSVWARECHLMIEEPRPLIALFAPHSDLIVFHLEATAEPHRTVAAIREAGCQVGIAVKPTTPAESIFPLLNDVDEVVVMAVEPGFAGGRYLSSVVEKVVCIRRQIDLLGRRLPIEIDGAVSAGTIPALARAGAERFVGGTSGLFRAGSLEQNARDLLDVIDDAVGTADPIWTGQT
jgi:ribulose-phosphate 3-epimerase